MPYKNSTFMEKAERHRKYRVLKYSGGGFEIRCRDWKYLWKKNRGSYLPPPDAVKARVIREKQSGRISDTAQTYVGLYGILACGKRSQPEGMKYLGLTPRKLGSEKDCRTAVSQYWRPRKNSSGSFRPTKNADKRVGDFMSSHKDIYKYAAEHLGGFKKFLESWKPGLYYSINPAASRVITPKCEDELSDNIIRRFNSGLCISSTYLKDSLDSRERELHRRIIHCAKTDLLGKKETFEEVVHRLTKIPSDDIHLGSGAQKKCAELTEDFTAFLFYWSSLLGLETWGFDTNNWIYHEKEALRFSPGEDRRADLRVGNRAIEVKTGIAKFSEERKEEIVAKYGNNGVWQTGEPVEKGAVFFHAKTKLYEHFFPAVLAAGLQIITYEDFHRYLEQLVIEMKKRASMYRDVRPITNLDYLVNLHREVSLHPFLLVRTENNFRREWSKSILEVLIERAQELRDQKFGEKS